MLGFIDMGKATLCNSWDGGGDFPHQKECCIDWVICGFENGPGKRPFNEQWAIELLRACRSFSRAACSAERFMKNSPNNIARVFPRRTKATPTDSLVFVDELPGLFPPKVDEVHISVAFTYDLERAEWLAKQWEHVAPVKIGGPATGMRSDEFVPGRYLKHGYVITSRGCPNNCWFCSVWKREGDVRELPITEGYNVLDDNLLACSAQHIMKVFAMLSEQKERPLFTGGLDSSFLYSDIIYEIKKLKPKRIYFAYDSPEDWTPLVKAARACWRVGFTPASHVVFAYVLIGYPKDTPQNAERRLNEVLKLGITPMAMLWRNETGTSTAEWRKVARRWAKTRFIYMQYRKKIFYKGGLLGGQTYNQFPEV
jgi:hypothetical protein